MKTDVRALVIVDMHGYFGARLQLTARGQLIALHVRPNDVVRLPDGQSLGELAGVIRIELPTGSFLVGPPDLHFDPVERVPVRVPNRSKDEGVRLRLLAVATTRAHGGNERRQKQHRRCPCRQAPEHPEMRRILQESSSSDSSLTASSSSSSSSISSSPTFFNSTGLTVITSKSAPHSGHETTAPSSTSSSSMSRSVSHSGQYTMISSTSRLPCYI